MVAIGTTPSLLLTNWLALWRSVCILKDNDLLKRIEGRPQAWEEVDVSKSGDGLEMNWVVGLTSLMETGRDDLKDEPFKEGINSPKERAEVWVGGRAFIIEPRKGP